ncbi:MAG: NAD(P)H-dependent oxidoreductase subunit E [Pseudomonadota bacterium]
MKPAMDLDGLLEKYPGDPRHLIALLQDVQAAYNYISPEAMMSVCQHVGAPLTQAWSVATFYKSFSLKPRGEHIIKVCLGTACHLKGAGRIVDNLCRDLCIDPGQTTTDMKFTIETVNCLGACALAPVVVMDGDYYGNMNSRKMDKLISKAMKE